MKGSLKLRVSSLLLASICILGLTSFVNLRTRTILNSKMIFEILLFFLMFLSFSKLKISRKVKIHTLYYLSYFGFSLLYFAFYERTGKLADFLIIYKSFIYLFMLSFFVGKQILPQVFLRKLFNLLLVLFTLKYILMKIFGFGFQGRPELFTENNFEIIMILILYIGVYSREQCINKKDLFYLSIIFVLSGSRSGIACFFILLFFIDFGRSIKIKLLKYILLAICLVGVLIIFFNRLGSQSIEDIDRIKFLFSFISEIKTWQVHNYIFGSSFMTPMSPSTSRALSYYHELFSDHSVLLTYSVVLHSFVLRTIFDHGIFGFCSLFYSIWRYLTFCLYTKNEKLIIVLILIATGLSVSSLNSIFVSLSLGLLLITKRDNNVNLLI